MLVAVLCTPPPHLQAHVDALYEYVLRRSVYLAVAVLLKLAHGDILAMTRAADQTSGGDAAAVVVSRNQTLGSLPTGGTSQQQVFYHHQHNVTICASHYTTLLLASGVVAASHVPSMIYITTPTDA